MADGSGRSLLDDEGRLFGLVNVIDVLVVLLFLAVVVAGVTLLLPGGESGSDSGGEVDTRFATIDLGQQPVSVAERISPGDEWDPDGTAHSLTITDVYRFDADGSTNVTIRAAVDGTRIRANDAGDAPTLEFRGDRLRLGRTLGIETGEYSADGQVTRVDQSGRDLPIQESTFVVETQVSSGTTDEIAVGDQFRVAGDKFARSRISRRIQVEIARGTHCSRSRHGRSTAAARSGSATGRSGSGRRCRSKPASTTSMGRSFGVTD